MTVWVRVPSSVQTKNVRLYVTVFTWVLFDYNFSSNSFYYHNKVIEWPQSRNNLYNLFYYICISDNILLFINTCVQSIINGKIWHLIKQLNITTSGENLIRAPKNLILHAVITDDVRIAEKIGWYRINVKERKSTLFIKNGWILYKIDLPIWCTRSAHLPEEQREAVRIRCLAQAVS